MLNNCQPVSVTSIIDEQDVVKINNNNLHVKGKPVFSWIKNPNNNTNTQISKPNIILSTGQLINHNTNNNKEKSNQAELKGVQNLKNLWNTRIRAFKDTKLNTSKTLGPAKSCGCLLQEGETTLQAVTKALSLHNCAEITETTTSLRLTKDNFYKYKRAETIENNKINNLSPSCTPSFTSQLIFNFPLINATKRGDKIHWMRRDILPSQRKHSTEESPPFVALEADNKMNVMTSSEKVEASPATLQMASTTSPQLNLISIDNNGNDSSQLFSETRDAIGAHCSSNSPRSIESTTTTSRRKNPNSNRKYSFKTQVKSYHSPRKMPYYNNSTASNKVAKLTQQFNEIIQKDKKILAEVKRKNGILLSRGGHVYKVIENSEQVMTATQATVLPNKKDTIPGSINGSTVQRAIKTFESKTSEKPKVPVKSAQVLKKKKELANQNVNKGEFKNDAVHEIEEKIYLRAPTSKTVSEDLANDCISNVNKVVQGIENNCNRKEPKTELVETELRNLPINPCAENQIDLELFKKNRYAKIYEKFRFRGASARKDETADAKVNAKLDALKTKKMEMKLHLKAINIPEDILNNSCNASLNQPEINLNLCHSDTLDKLPETNSTKQTTASDSQLQHGINQIPKSEDIANPIGEFKILSALEEVNQKIEILTKQSDTNAELKYSPNESFLYQGIIKTKTKEDQLFEAVNTSLVNFTEAKTLNNLHKPEEVKEIEENTSEDVESGEEITEESIYEIITPINPNVTLEPDPVLLPQKSFLFCNSNKNSETCITGESTKIKKEQVLKLDSYETCNNYESINGSCEAKTTTCTYDGYEICENPDLVSPPRPPKEPTELQRNTTDELPELPKPKRIIPKKAFTAVGTSEISSCVSESGSINDEENIYDTIKGGHHSYEVLQKNSDTISLTSNAYESINNYRKQISLRNAGSSSTISSDHKTNSLYEVSMVNGILTGCQTYSFSYHTSSENSDDWVDISDSEVNAYDQMEKQQFIVIRERMKHHRSPDWSKRVRDKRLNQAISDDDDVDHFYEPLFVHGNKYNDRVSEVGSASTPKNHKNSHYVNSNLHLPDDYDSFDTDDDVYEDENESVKKNDSGVDISKVKLPNPPPSKNQVYAFVKKVKNFISYKKSPSDPNKSFADSIQAKMYENTQFQVEGNEYQSTLKPTRRAPDKPKTPKVKSKKIVDKPINKPITHDDNIYENTDFHNQNMKVTSQLSPGNVVQLSTSEKNLIAANDIAIRSKSKTGKSFKSRLKSLGAVGFDNKQLSTLTTARSTFYISEITSTEQDSGIFEKTSSGDITSNKAELEPTTEHRPITTIRKNKKETNSTLSSSYRRRTTIGMRPNDPPPPPPLQSEDSKRGKQRPSTTSWYAECGVFKVDNNMNIDDGNSEKQALNSNKNMSSTSWYAEAGLYQTSGISVASSSGSSGVSTANDGIPGDDSAHHVFLNEPLYQIYNAEKLESISRDMEEHESADGYEEIGLNGHRNGNEQIKPARPSALQLVGPRSGPSRTLWSEIPEVISSEILPTLTPRERSLQEAKFEIITSEASYLKSLNLLRSHFMNHQTFHDTAIISSRDRKTLFSYIAPVHECSEKLLSQLESCWQDNIMLLGLSKRIYQCAEKHFHVYVSYCEHQGKMDRTLRKLKEAKSIFSQKLDLLEADPVCCGLTLHSFLMLPMQRITRLPLLIDAVFSKVHHNDDEYENWKLTLAILNKIVAQCNDAANRCEQSYEIERISRQLEFPSHIRALAIAPAGVSAVGSKPRFLVKKGELVHLIWRGDDAKLTFGKKFAKSSIYAFLFSDLMVLTKRKGDEQFTVFDYCPRNMLTISSGDAIPQLPTKDTSQTCKNLILMTLLENYEKKTVELILSCPSVSELERWLQATRPPKAETPGEKLYEQWDCPQVIAKHEYVANEPDLLSLEVGDVVNVSRKLPDGWFSGERIRDGAVGWFPGTFTEEVNSAHVRARNLKQRYRLLTFTATYLELQKRK